MKNLFTLFALLGVVQLASGQIELQSNFKHSIDDVAEVDLIVAEVFALGLHTENAVDGNWSLSNLGKAVNTLKFGYVNPDKTKYTSVFTDAKLALDNGYGNYVYYTYSKDEFQSVGTIRSIFTDGESYPYPIRYNTPLTLMKYPVKYGEEFSSKTTYEATREYPSADSTIVDSIFGTLKRTTKVDGYGSITMPDNKVYKVLRLAIELSTKDSIISQEWGNTVSENTSNWFEYYSPDFASPIVSVYLTETTPSHIEVLNTETSTKMVSIGETGFSGINIYPNPTSSFIQVSLTEANARSATVYNISGQQELHVKLDDHTINLSALEPGSYFLILKNRDGQQIGQAQVIKQ